MSEVAQEAISAFALTELEAGSDPSKREMKAVYDWGTWAVPAFTEGR
jgi:alkylation response protein AidB-like acyl-CoA dehydrogenase